MKEIIYLKSIFKDMIWGGSRLRSDFGYDIPTDTTGECWAIAAHKNGDCVVDGGTYDGKTLSELWNHHSELFAHRKGDRFPLLIKIIDAKDDLSIQVHPNDEYAKQNEAGSLGKTECWYILGCQEDSEIVIGHNAKDKEQLKDMIKEGQWDSLIRRVPIKVGDFFQIEPGTVHAIKGGTVILETQQNSDITYRLYDYDRLSNGEKRELHIDKSIDVISCPHEEIKRERYSIPFEEGELEELIQCEYYHVRKLNLYGSITMEQKELFTLVSVIDGNGKIDGTDIRKGQHFILPHGYGEYNLEGNMVLSLVNC